MDTKSHGNPVPELHKEATRLIKALVAEDSPVTREFLGNTLAVAFNTMIGHLQTNYQAIERAKHEWESSLDAVSDPLFIHDREFMVMRCNRAYAEAAGMSYREIIGKPYYEVFPKTDGPTEGCRKTSERQEDGEEEITVPAADRVFNAKLHLVRDLDGAYIYSLHILQDVTARKKAETALQDSERKFRTIFEGALDGILLADAETKRFYTGNERICRMLGYSLEELRELGVSDIHPPQALPYVQEQFEKQLSRVIDLAGDIPVKRKDGSVFYADINSSPVTIGGRTYLLGIFRDITARKRMEMALKESEERYRTLVETLPNLVYTLAGDGTIVFLSSAFDKITGWPRHEWLGKPFMSLIHEDDLPLAFENLQQAQRGEARPPRELRVRTKSGEYLIGEFTPIPQVEKETLSGIVRDITERKKAEKELKESEARYRRITEGLTDYQYTVRVENGRAVETTQSPACVTVTGYMAEEYAANPYLWIQMVVPEDRERVMQHVQQILAGDDVSPIEHRITRKNGETRWISDTTILFKDASGKLLSYDGVIKDITERKKADKEFHELFLASIESLASAIEAKSPWTRGHSERVADYAAGIGQALGLTNGELEKLRIAALLHDIGKIGTYDSLLEKPGKLTDTEYEMVKCHPGKGAEMLAPISQLHDIIPWIRGHHERFDGKGYPDGLSGEDIPLQARILAVADTFDSMTAERPYRATPGKAQALEEIQRHAGTQFDPGVVEAFLRTEPLGAVSHGESIVTG